MGINRADVFPSKYLSATDVDGREIPLNVKYVQIEEVADGERKAVLYFNKGSKGMVLNMTNWTMLEDAYGMDTDAWVDQPVILCVERTSFKGKPTKGLRIHIPKASAPRAHEQLQRGQNELNPPLDDDIPF